MKRLSVVFPVGVSHFIFPLIVMSSVLNMPSPSQASPSQPSQMGNLPMVLDSWERTDKMKDKMEVESKSHADSNANDKIYDFIVVGAGTAGSIVAARLSEQFSVLLLEAGGQPHINHENTNMALIMTKHSGTDWMYPSTEKKYTFSGGKGLGGSGNLNYLENLYEGTFEDYNEWMEATEDPGWGLSMLQPYVQKVKGYLKKQNTSKGESAYFRSTYKALIKTTSKLDVQKYSHVHKIIMDSNGHAAGVEYERHGGIKHANVSKEVILSAGTFGTPKILQLSGVGMKSTLKQFNITTHVESPVGKNFQDHFAIPVGPFFRSKEPVANKTEHMSAKQDSWNSSTILRMPLVNLRYNDYSKEISHFLGINDDTLKDYMTKSTQTNKGNSTASNPNSMFINVALKKPLSRGEVNIAGSNPKLKPVVIPFLLNQDDKKDFFSEKQLLIDGLEETVRLMEVNPTHQTKFTETPFPGCESFIFRGFGYWECYIRKLSISLSHGVGTCSFGSANSKIPSVVNAELKVYGVPGLRVIDASVMPTIVGTFPYLSVAVIAERGADLIRKDYQFEQYRRSEMINSPSRGPEIEEQPKGFKYFQGFNIQKLSDIEHSPSNDTEEVIPASRKDFWKKVDQTIQKAYSHTLDSSLDDDDLAPPGEQHVESQNPSYFPVRPLAADLIFHPLVPQRSPLADGNPLERNDKAGSFNLISLLHNFFNLFNFPAQRRY